MSDTKSQAPALLRARLVATSVNGLGFQGGGKVSEAVAMSAVYSNDKASPNYTFSQATPQAELIMTITNPAAFGLIEPGGAYDITITPVPTDAPASS